MAEIDGVYIAPSAPSSLPLQFSALWSAASGGNIDHGFGGTFVFKKPSLSSSSSSSSSIGTASLDGRSTSAANLLAESALRNIRSSMSVSQSTRFIRWHAKGQTLELTELSTEQTITDNSVVLNLHVCSLFCAFTRHQSIDRSEWIVASLFRTILFRGSNSWKQRRKANPYD